ncbi:MAG: hypothetical protein PHC51_00715 [bacterium]|nr:hypothetical protein [bacterium]
MSDEMNNDADAQVTTKNDPELIEKLVSENLGWAEAIARNVARSWNLDWQMDGLDGGAYEGLLFCATRYNDSLGVPFRAYARRRIHEAATEEARKSKNWRRATGSNSEASDQAREISAKLFQLFPELHSGSIDTSTDSAGDGLQIAVKSLLAGASLLAIAEDQKNQPDDILEYKEMLTQISHLNPIHQTILWEIYWIGKSMRTLASEWGIDELTIIREHSTILVFLEESMKNNSNHSTGKALKIRPTLRPLAETYGKENWKSPFSIFQKKIRSHAIDILSLLLLLAPLPTITTFALYHY